MATLRCETFTPVLPCACFSGDPYKLQVIAQRAGRWTKVVDDGKAP